MTQTTKKLLTNLLEMTLVEEVLQSADTEHSFKTNVSKT
jgi:hypothetical protein